MSKQHKPVIELKRIKTLDRLSDETTAYQAELFVDGKHFADVWNRGDGREDEVDLVDGVDFEALEALEARIAETYPKTPSPYDTSRLDDESLWGICERLVYEHIQRQDLKADLARKVLIVEDGQVRVVQGRKSQALMDAVARDYPDAAILNRLPFEEALAIILDISEKADAKMFAEMRAKHAAAA